MKLKKLVFAVSAAFLLITAPQVHADDDDDDYEGGGVISQASPEWEQYLLLQAQIEYWRAAMYLYELQLSMDDAKKRGDKKAYKDAEKIFRNFERGLFRRIKRAYEGSRRGRIIWIPVPGWNPWSPIGQGQPGQGGECTRDPGPCLQCVNGFIVPDDGDNPHKRCYQCAGGIAVPADGFACDDYNPCTINDVCSGGSCRGSKIQWTSPHNPQCR